ncbi:MAG: hypothetical protein NC117_05190 [Pseudoflavonifractor sp.]|nr:hypothetical protein [Pseudoflavonifractor sp.]
MKKDNSFTLRYAMLAPLALMIATIVSSCISYSNAKQDIASDLNDAMFAMANENSGLWARQDTIAALRHMHAATHKPLIYQASDVKFRNPALRDEAYFTLSLVDSKNVAPKIHDNKTLAWQSTSRFASDSIMLMPERAADGLAIRVQGFADCSMASVFAASDQRLPGVLLVLSILSMASMLVWRRKEMEASPSSAINPLDGIRLTPMQRQFAQLLLDSPHMRVDKSTLCSTLWGNKTNAEESLYTLVRRTKTALAASNIEIVCNRGDSYELRVKD